MTQIYTFDDRKKIEAEAREWVVRLDGGNDPDDQIRAELLEWLAQSSVHRDELFRLARYWDDANVLAELSITSYQQSENNRRFPNIKISKLIPDLLTLKHATALSIIFFSVLGTMIFMSRDQTDFTSNGIYATAIGELRQEILADGSEIQINTDSQVQVDYSDSIRKIRLLRGEAHFDVTSSPDRPFEVYAGRSMVKAVGTAFSVYLSQDNVHVTVTEGRVDLATIIDDGLSVSESAKNDGHLEDSEQYEQRFRQTLRKIGSLENGQKATISNNITDIENVSGESPAGRLIQEIKVLAAQELDRELSWREGYLVFAGEPLDQVVKEVSRYTPITIEIIDPDLSQLSIGGRFRVGETEAMIDVLQSSLGIQVTWLNEYHIQLSSM